jgi:hypothetical protein
MTDTGVSNRHPRTSSRVRKSSPHFLRPRRLAGPLLVAIACSAVPAAASATSRATHPAPGAAFAASKAPSGILPTTRRFKVENAFAHSNGVVEFDLSVPGRGYVDVMETAWKSNEASAAVLEPAKRRFVFARAHVGFHRRGSLHFVVHPNARGARLVAHHTYPVVIRLWFTYTPPKGKGDSFGLYGVHVP